MANKRYIHEEKTPDWVENVSLIVDSVGIAAILFLTGVLIAKCFL